MVQLCDTATRARAADGAAAEVDEAAQDHLQLFDGKLYPNLQI